MPINHRSYARPRHLVRAAAAALLFVAALIVLLAPGLLSPAVAAPRAQEPVTPPSALNGRPLFEENCAPCHGAQGLGDGPAAAELPNGAAVLADPTLARSASMQEWFEVTKEGRMDRMMPPWKNRLSDDQIWDAVAYAYSLHVTEQSLAQGSDLWTAECAQCHGDSGAGNGPEAAANGWQLQSLADLAYATGQSDAAWFDLVSAGRGDMPSFSQTLSDEQRWAAVQFARTFSYEPDVTPPLSAGEGRIVGKMVNNSAGGGAVAGSVITLFPFENFEDRRSLEATVGPDGDFSFDGLPVEPAFAYMATTEYGGVSFGSNVLTFQDGASQVDLTLPVWESATEAGDISIELAQLFVEPHQGALLVGELYRVKHDGDRVYTGSQPVAPGRNEVLTFPLPAEVTALAMDGGEIGDRFIRTNSSIIDTQPLYPGSKQILLRYLLPYDGTKASVERELPYDVANLSVLVVDGPKVDTSLVEGEQQTLQDLVWNNYTGADLKAGQEIKLDLSGLERASAAAAAINPAGGVPASSVAVVADHPGVLAGAVILAGLLAVAVLAAYLLRKPEPKLASVEIAVMDVTGPISGDLAAERQSLLQSIARLDDRFSAGELDQRSYQTLRTAEKRQLLRVVRQMEDEQASPDASTLGNEDKGQPDA